jgi:hypothetical protein
MEDYLKVNLASKVTSGRNGAHYATLVRRPVGMVVSFQRRQQIRGSGFEVIKMTCDMEKYR